MTTGVVMDGSQVQGTTAVVGIPDGREPGTSGARGLGDAVVWTQRDLGWEQLVEEARRLGRAPALQDLSDDELEEQVCGMAVQLAVLTAAWLELLCEFVIRGSWAEQGARTPAQWLSWRLGIAPSTAREQVRVALRLRELPGVRRRFAAGELSYSKVRAITRIAVPEIEELVLSWAEVATAAQLERIAADFRTTRRAGDADGPQGSLGSDYGWRTRTHADGTMSVTFRAPVEECVELCQILERRSDASDEGSEDPAQPSREARLVQELLALVVDAASREPVDTSGLDRHTLVLHASAEALGEPTTDTPVGDVVAVEEPHGRVRHLRRTVLRQLACDAGIVLAAVDGRGSPLDVGRRDRRLSAALRRAVHLRDRDCRFPGCGATRHLHAHHVQHWADGGATDLDNLVLLCSQHHRFVHRKGWHIEVSADGLHRFLGPGRDQLEQLPRGPDPARVEGSPPWRQDLPWRPDALVPEYGGPLRRGDRDIIVAVLEQEITRLAPELAAAA